MSSHFLCTGRSVVRDTRTGLDGFSVRRPRTYGEQNIESLEQCTGTGSVRNQVREDHATDNDVQKVFRFHA